MKRVLQSDRMRMSMPLRCAHCSMRSVPSGISLPMDRSVARILSLHKAAVPLTSCQSHSCSLQVNSSVLDRCAVFSFFKQCYTSHCDGQSRRCQVEGDRATWKHPAAPSQTGRHL